MFRALRRWVNDEGPEEAALAKSREDEERRLDERHQFAGHRVVIRDRRLQSFIGLKDLSCRGACGISEMPLSPGAIVFLEIRKKRYHAAEVRWVRNALIGLEFVRPLQPDMVEKFHAAFVAKRSAAAKKSGRTSWAPARGALGRR